jgi:hypothetical protein
MGSAIRYSIHRGDHHTLIVMACEALAEQPLLLQLANDALVTEILGL